MRLLSIVDQSARADRFSSRPPYTAYCVNLSRAITATGAPYRALAYAWLGAGVCWCMLCLAVPCFFCFAPRSSGALGVLFDARPIYLWSCMGKYHPMSSKSSSSLANRIQCHHCVQTLDVVAETGVGANGRAVTHVGG
uniref:LITAF domain-containing protein n=1 Tax=Plectus sambesii TaxID=2011161 RepID=A0A914V675_9BILA